jgi:death-on-curing protein
MLYLTAEQVLFIHARLIAETGGLHGVRDLAMLESALGRSAASFDGRNLYPDPFAKAAALMESLINNHPFVDGNKRTGIAAAALLLRINGYKLTADPADLEITTLHVAQNKMNLTRITAWLRQNAHEVST